MFLAPIFSSTGVYTGDIGHSLRLRSSASAYLNRVITTDTTSTYFAAIKRGKLGVITPIFDSSIKFNANDTLTAFGLTTTAVFRDPTSWLFIHVSNGGLYVNGVSYGAVTTSSITNMRIGYDGTNYADMYIARIGVVGGSSSVYTNFGYLNTEINEWVTKTESAVKAVVDAGGANSFMLDFDDGSSLTTLGYDKSSKGNNWTLNNFSLTADSTYDHMLDVPGNSYATLNPLIPSAANITNGNLSSGTTAARGTLNSTAFNSQWFVTAGASAVTAGVIADSGTASTISVTANKVFAFKMTTAGALSYKNVTDAGGWTSIATGLTGNRWPYSITQAASWNFGQQPLPEALDTGFKALCQANMPEPAIKNPERHFDVLLATGANIKSTAEAMFPSNFLEWIKDRANSNNHQLIDTVRGTSAVLQSNTTAAETVYSTPAGSSVGWVWKAGGTPVTNSAGSIQSQVSANVEAGFSIVTYTGTGAIATVGHGLGKAPGLVITKGKNYSGVDSDWIVNDASAPWTKVVALNSTIATITDSSFYNNTAPTSSVFTLGSNVNHNTNTYQYVAYCFAEIPGYSKIGSYTGNGSAGGPFVHCGFKPKFVIIKSTAAGDWKIYDAARPGYNVQGGDLKPNTTGVETVAAEVDFTSSGFKLRVATGPNAAQTYIYYAIADVPGKYSLGR